MTCGSSCENYEQALFSLQSHNRATMFDHAFTWLTLFSLVFEVYEPTNLFSRKDYIGLIIPTWNHYSN